jgi:cell division transport system permease protein
MIIAGIKDFSRNSWLSIAATAVMVVALLMILLTVVLNVTARNAIIELSKNLKVSVYLQDDVKEEAVKSLRQEFQINPYVADVTYTTKDEAQKKFATSYQNDKKLLEGLALIGADALPASIDVSVANLSKIQEVGDIAKQDKYKNIVESVSLGKTDAKKTIDRAAAAQRYITLASLVVAIIFGIVSMLIIFNTIRMAIFTRGEEIRIMKLIGATPGYIRGPFLIEASLYGIIAGTIAAGAMLSIIYSLGGKIANQAEFASTYQYLTQTSVMLVLFFGAILAGILVGVISSMFAMEKHLKLKRW